MDVPKVGRVKKQTLYIVGGGVAAFVLWRYWSASRSAAADTAATDTTATDSTGSYGIDGTSGAGGYYDPNGGGIGGSTTVGDVMTTDAQWYNAALLALEDAGYDTGAAALALGKYLRTEPLTSAEQDMVKIALAAAGNPPSGAKPIVTSNAPTPSGLTAPQNLRSGGAATTAAIPLAWDAVSGASGYVVYRGGTQLATVTGTAYTAGSLSPNTSYAFTVRATNTGGSLSPASGTYTGKTAPAPDQIGHLPTGITGPGTTAPKPAAPAVPPHHTRVITPSLNSLSKLVADDNKRTGRHHNYTDVWNFNLRYRDSSTVAKLRARGMDKTYIGSSFWIPNA